MEIINPYDGCTGGWLKGQLHLHSRHSDGADPPAAVVRDYEARGYDFIAFTDHNTVPPSGDLDVATSMVVIPGEEYGCSRRSGDQELGVIGIDAPLPPDLEHPEFMAAASASGAFVVFNHPTWHIHHWPIFKMLKLRRAYALEVYNAVCDSLPGAAECADKWDRLLTCGYRIWGVATDDAHAARHRDRAWVMVDAERSRRSIVEALKAGRFYASSGVRINSIAVEGSALRIESADAQEIRFFADRGSMRGRRMGTSASCEIQDNDIFLRAELYGDGARKAWTQPVFVESERSRELADEFRNWYLGQQKQISEW
jgi:predicted metal-dependent phosphoesterase TrpH